MKKILSTACIAAFLVGCTTTPTQAPVEDKSATGAPAAVTPGGASTSGSTAPGVTGSGVPPAARPQVGSPGGNPLRDPSNVLSKRSIYFEFDSFTVSEQYKQMVDAHARYLAANRNARATLQGHADERGSREYNIALGQKRSDAVKRMMALLGVQEAQVETVSFGEERPKGQGHDEAAWTENRRVDIQYAGE